MSLTHDVQTVGCRRRTRATRYCTRIVLYTDVDAQCDKLANVVGRTSTVANTVNLVNTNFYQHIDN